MKTIFLHRLPIATLVLPVLLHIGCGSNPSTYRATEEASSSTKPAPQTPISPWRVDTSKNELSGEPTITAINGYGDESMVIRRRGRKLDCYVTTGEFLETLDNMNNRIAPVKYKFDDGPIVRQGWTLSDDNTALFYPGNPKTFLQKMRRANRFVIEYSPSQKVPQTESFDVSPFPAEFTGTAQ